METLLTNILGFFAFGAIGFWLLVITLSVVYTCAVELDKHGVAIFFTIVASLLLWPEIKEVLSNWRLTLLIIAAYGVAGGGWSVFRWFRYCRKFIETHPAKSIDDGRWDGGHRVAMSEAEHAKAVKDFYTKELKPADHKSKLIGWIVYWPWSLVWNFAGDFFTGIYDALANVYNRVSAAVIAKAIGR